MRGKEQAGRGGGRGKVSKAAETEAREMESWSENERDRQMWIVCFEHVQFTEVNFSLLL